MKKKFRNSLGMVLLPVLMAFAPTSVLAEDYIVTFNAEKACNELMQHAPATDEYTLDERHLACLQTFAYFGTKYPQ
jgi:hypothetical protein